MEKSKKYSIIYADPPWDYRGQKQQAGPGKETTGGAISHYSTMSIDDLCKFALPETEKDALLFLWVGSPILPDAMRLIDAWGFTFMTVAFVWDKVQVNPGYYTMSQCEMCFVAKKNKGKIPQPRGARNVRQFLSEKRQQHSRKPDEVRDRIVKMFPTQNKIELFARQTTPGWDVWGNETDKFDTIPTVQNCCGQENQSD